MYNNIKGLHINEYQRENGDNTRKLACEDTVKLNANAQEFVPRYKREQPAKDDAIVGNSNMSNTNNDDQKPKSNLMLPWKGFPNKSQKRKVLQIEVARTLLIYFISCFSFSQCGLHSSTEHQKI